MNVLENGAPILLQFQNWLHVFDCLCVSNFKLFKHVIKLINSKYLLVSNVCKLQMIRGQTE